MNKSVVIIPTYNEIENVELIIQAVFDLGQGYHVLIVDDNSPDGTAEIIASLISAHPGRVHVINRPGKLGLGTAYITGFKWALAKEYAFIFEMDADFSHTPSDLIRLKQACLDGADVAVGSRYCKGVNVVNWPIRRILLSYGASLYVRIITSMPVHDPTAGFMCYRASALRMINFDAIRFVGYAFQIEMKYRAFKRGARISEVSIVFTDRIRGVSKMSGAIIKEAVWGVFKMRLDSIFDKKRFYNAEKDS